MNNGIKKCSKCGKNMIMEYRSIALVTYPQKFPWDWWCACGNTEEGGIERGQTNEEIRQKNWEMAQNSVM